GRMQTGAKQSVRNLVFWPPFALLLTAVVFSFVNLTAFLDTMNNINDWILAHFDWLFSYTTLCLLISLIVVFFSPLGKVKIGGKKAQPVLSKWRWFSITLCTTIATGILFWAAAEPMYHVYAPPASLELVPGSSAAREFTMATMFMHWSFSPYAIYCVPSLVFALCYHNLQKPFTIGASLSPALGKFAFSTGGHLIDALALFALISGMSASLGAGILIISGGIEAELGLSNGKSLMAIVAATIVLTFVFSAISGLHKGIARLSNINAQTFIFFLGFVLLAGPTANIAILGIQGLSEYASSFIARSTNQLTATEDGWTRAWTVFYLANWYAWAPITALFLGRIAKGYTVRQFIIVNLVLPSLCAIVWMSTFSGATIFFDDALGGAFRESLVSNGPESVVFLLLDNLPYAAGMTLTLIGVTFVSFVTAADSNTDAMSRLCTSADFSTVNPSKTNLYLKIVWGATIGIISWVMVSFASVDGLRMLSNLGGLPAIFIIIITNISLFIMLKKVLTGERLEPVKGENFNQK
ncbi:MAG: BCCT family transporter, partial [Pseudomonadota bacterium]